MRTGIASQAPAHGYDAAGRLLISKYGKAWHQPGSGPVRIGYSTFGRDTYDAAGDTLIAKYGKAGLQPGFGLVCRVCVHVPARL